MNAAEKVRLLLLIAPTQDKWQHRGFLVRGVVDDGRAD